MKIKKVVKKLPWHLIDRWSHEVDRWLNKRIEMRQNNLSSQQSSQAICPPFSAFCKFVNEEARMACNPVISSKTLREEENKKEDIDKKKLFWCRCKWGQAWHRKKQESRQTKKRVMLILQRPTLQWRMQGVYKANASVNSSSAHPPPPGLTPGH